ncbi:bactofilin family protein [Alkaliphilus peptidifermentans]|uniref:Protein CcmA, bactofilin family n=1 Tax=Alkaliphilus peptidifermentans DSM 18978 TaxID=1120976 RepID=A0A1G5CQA6_9FIRM|nr:polymer-forming cytoskeletal protein [Alkaliphilus peptidifermentans]SCY04633.1 protein CcmA, bactofilin family [Alkaliphilus peptidifermentans DSM 18978]
MFSKKEDVQYTKFTTLIGADCVFEGRLNTKGTIRIEGELKGDINLEGNLYIGETGRLIGNVNGSNVFVAGEVHGNVYATGQLRVAAKGKLYGDVNVKSFVLDENAIFDGNCKMLNNEKTLELENL